jgi:polar amino acid transport system permease protein
LALSLVSAFAQAEADNANNTSLTPLIPSYDQAQSLHSMFKFLCIASQGYKTMFPHIINKKYAFTLDFIKFIAASAFIIWLIYASGSHSDYNWQWYRVPQYFGKFSNGSFIQGPLLRGLMVTLQVSVVSFILSSLMGLVTALCRLSNLISLRIIARTYLELIRNTPLLVQLFFIYFVIAPVMDLSRFSSAVLALSLFEGAYASEIIRAGIIAVPKGQWEASAGLGLSKYRIYRHVILPQAMPMMIPPLAGQTISLVKDSALVSTIALYDLTMEGQMIIAETYMVFELWFAIAGVYLMLTIALSLLTRQMEEHFAISPM